VQKREHLEAADGRLSGPEVQTRERPHYLANRLAVESQEKDDWGGEGMGVGEARVVSESSAMVRMQADSPTRRHMIAMTVNVRVDVKRLEP
jgi:hypothetical protein